MKINDVEKITGLKRKAIRLYESKGLITVSRDENGYRNYSSQNVEQLKSIKILRSVGVSVSDIKLFIFGVITKNELLDKRKDEILKESGKNSEKYQICQSILNNAPVDHLLDGDFSESDEIKEISKNLSLCVGIDIGTTTISAVVYSLDTREQIEDYSLPHNSYTVCDSYSEQSTDVILEKAKKLLFHILDTYENIVSVGITGQMHGIVYTDSCCTPVSNLINWQDKRGDKILKNDKSACQLIYEKTGERISTGYGIATHYYNLQTQSVPENACGICSIMDLFAAQICGLEKIICHTSVAAGMGLFDIESGKFMYDKLALIGIDKSLLPSVTDKSIAVGDVRGIPVSIPLGDNQASFLGSVSQNEEAVLINIGTGSQVSAVSDYRKVGGDIELRPFIEGKYLMCGSALCGGSAYSMLEEFFRSYIISCGMADVPQYRIMNQIAKEGYQRGERGLLVNASFCGKRSNPSYRGSITEIDRQEFTPSNLILGVLNGMCAELYELYNQFPMKCTRAICSGGAIKKNPLLLTLMVNTFGMETVQSVLKEEASTGVALFSAFTTGKINYTNGFSDFIKYQ